MKSIWFTLVFVALTITLSAQQTGSFQITIDFNEADYDFTRTLYFHVPPDYDASLSYPLVVGFRGGPNSNAGDFRNHIRFLADSIGAIVVCPENADHFWNEEGLTKQLFQYTVDTTSMLYNINPDLIYLTGLSYGGRHSVIVAMDTDDGAIPNIRGVIPFAAGAESDLQPNYDAVVQFAPACICIGLSDSQNFIDVANRLHDDLQNNGAAVLLNEIEGVGHTVAFPAFQEEMMECFDFIESNYPITDVDELVQTSQVQVYPNPVQDQLQLEVPEEWELQRLYLVDALGRHVQELSTDSRSFVTATWPKTSLWLVLETATERLAKPLIIK